MSTPPLSLLFDEAPPDRPEQQSRPGTLDPRSPPPMQSRVPARPSIPGARLRPRSRPPPKRPTPARTGYTASDVAAHPPRHTRPRRYSASPRSTTEARPSLSPPRQLRTALLSIVPAAARRARSSASLEPSRTSFPLLPAPPARLIPRTDRSPVSSAIGLPASAGDLRCTLR